MVGGKHHHIGCAAKNDVLAMSKSLTSTPDHTCIFRAKNVKMLAKGVDGETDDVNNPVRITDDIQLHHLIVAGGRRIESSLTHHGNGRGRHLFLEESSVGTARMNQIHQLFG